MGLAFPPPDDYLISHKGNYLQLFVVIPREKWSSPYCQTRVTSEMRKLLNKLKVPLFAMGS